MITRHAKGMSALLAAFVVVLPSILSAQVSQLRDTAAVLVQPKPLLSAALAATVAAKEAEAAAVKTIADTEAESKKQLERLRDLEKNYQTFRFGLSLGWRHNISKSVWRDVSINPANNIITVDKIDRGAFVLSGVVSAHPWRNPALVSPNDSSKNKTLLQKNSWRFGFIANLNLAEFGPGSIQYFNKPIEGGIGMTMKLNEEFAVAAVWERLFGRNLRAFVKANEVLTGSDGKPVTVIDMNDDTYFRDDNMTTMSFKFVYYIK